MDRMVTDKGSEILNRMLDAEADEITGAARYERSGSRKAYRTGHYERDLTVKAGKLSVRVPKLKGVLFRVGGHRTLPTPRGECRGGADRHVSGRRLHKTGR